MSPAAAPPAGPPRDVAPRLGLAEARARLLEAAATLDGAESVAVEQALGRVTAGPVLARSAAPHFHAAAMDGIAVRAGDTAAASRSEPVALRAASPASPPHAPASGEPLAASGHHPPFAWVDTGNPMPAWADAVIMIEQLEPLEPGGDVAARPCAVRVREAAAPWQHVRVVGEDLVSGELLLPRGHRLRPQDLAVLLAAGVGEVAVRPRPIVAILPTGDELVEPGEALVPGRVVESNSRMVAAWVRQWGGEARRLPRVGDDPEAIARSLRAALREADVVCVIAGSSAGSRDFTARALGELGTILARGIELVPARPTILARLHRPAGASEVRARVALGLPGYPVAAAVACRELLEPLLAQLLGAPPPSRPATRAVLSRRLESKPGVEEVVRVGVARVGERLVARPLARGSGALLALVQADGLVRVAPEELEIAAGRQVSVELLRSIEEIERQIVVAGGADPALAALEDVLREADPGLRIAASAPGAADAPGELARGECHAVLRAAPILAATAAEGSAPRAVASGEGLPFAVVPLARRERGLMVAAGNPLGLRCAEDLGRPGVRQIPALKRGGATRVAPRWPVVEPAADRLAAPGAPAGADGDELSALAAAAAVATGVADVAVGTRAAAEALGLDFVALVRDDLELVLRCDFAASEVGARLQAAVRSEAFSRALARIAGYDSRRREVVEPPVP